MLRLLSNERKFYHVNFTVLAGRLVRKGSKAERGRNLDCRRGRKAAAVRCGIVIKKVAAADVVARLQKLACNAQLIIAPFELAFKAVYIGNVRFHAYVKVGRTHTDNVVLALSCDNRGFHCERRGKHGTAAVVNVFADKVYPSRRGENADFLLVVSVKLKKHILHFGKFH